MHHISYLGPETTRGEYIYNTDHLSSVLRSTMMHIADITVSKGTSPQAVRFGSFPQHIPRSK